MSKRYDEPADVEVGDEAGDASIVAFWWRGRRYRVRGVLARWREAGGWWESAADTAQPWARGSSFEILRVDAVPEPLDRNVSAGTPPRARPARVSAETPVFRRTAPGPASGPASGPAPRVPAVTTARALLSAQHHPAGRKRVPRTPIAGVYELSRDLRKGSWTLLRIWD